MNAREVAALPYLTDEEVAHICAPLIRADARCRYLRGMGLLVRERPNGQPLVGRAHFEEWGGKKATATRSAGQQPDTAALEDRAALVDDLLVYIGDLETVGAQVESDLLLTDRAYRDVAWLHDRKAEEHAAAVKALQAEREAHARTAKQAQDARRQTEIAKLAGAGRQAGLVHDSEERREAAVDALALRQEVEGLRKRVATLDAENEALRWKAAGRRIEVHMPATAAPTLPV